MPKPCTFPTLYDELKTISISFLKSHKYLEPGVFRGGTVTWSCNGVPTGNISIIVNTFIESPYLELDYNCNQVPINYRVQLTSSPSNLGKGVVWFFVCPKTGRLCRKLYLVGTYFYSRLAFRGCMYEKQTQSKKSRDFDNTLGQYFRTDKLFEQLYKKNFKKQYAGKPTRIYLSLTSKIDKAGRVDPSQL
jgi:hypothetical protein